MLDISNVKAFTQAMKVIIIVIIIIIINYNGINYNYYNYNFITMLHYIQYTA